MAAQVAADLRAAADVLERDGWTQRTAHHEGRHCVAGAVEVVIDPQWQAAGLGWEPGQNQRFSDAMCHAADLLGLPNMFSLTKWNDDEERTAEEVIAALRAAADRAEAEQ